MAIIIGGEDRLVVFISFLKKPSFSVVVLSGMLSATIINLDNSFIFCSSQIKVGGQISKNTIEII